jgi:hypothetical protein
MEHSVTTLVYAGLPQAPTPTVTIETKAFCNGSIKLQKKLGQLSPPMIASMVGQRDGAILP